MKSLVRNRKWVVSVLLALLIVFGTFSTGYTDITPVSDRTPQVRDAIVAAVPGVNSAADVTEAHLAAIIVLSLGNTGITSLKSGDFDGLSALTWLQLSSNALTALPKDVFKGLTSLRTLHLTHNDLTGLPTGVFSGLTSLESLWLYNNELTSLPKGAFSGLTSLASLKVSYNRLRSLPAGVFSGLTSLESLSLEGNAVDPFSLTVSLEKVADRQFKAVLRKGAPFKLVLPVSVNNGSSIGGATTVTIPAGSTESETLTVTRDLSAFAFGNVTAAIGTLPAVPSGHRGYTLRKSNLLPILDYITPLGNRTPQVREAIIRATGVSDHTQITGNHLASIRTLGTLAPPYYKKITTLKAGDFDGLTGLTTLELLYNDLTTLPAGVFDGLTALTRLELSYNRLPIPPAGVFNGLTALRTLELRSTGLTTLPAGIFDELTALTRLELHDNDLTALPAGVFDGLTALRTLWLGDNDLTTLPAGVFDELTALRTLWLGDNDLTTLPAGVFDELTALTGLYLDGNDLTTLPVGVFDGLSALTSLDLSDNAVDPLPLTVSLEKVADGQFKAVALTGAPFNIVVPLTVTNGSISGGATSITISTGSVESRTLTVTRTPGTTAAVTVDIGTLPSLPENHDGYALRKSTDLPLEVIIPTNRAPISNRTPQVRDAIVAAAGVNSADDVTIAHLAAITALGLDYKRITSLKSGDFQGLTALTWLNLSNNTISDISALKHLTALTGLRLDANWSIKDISALEDLTALTVLELYENSISDISALEDLTKLTKLGLSNNAISDISALEDLTKLTELWLFRNSISDISALEDLTALRDLWLDYNSISDISALEDLTKLTKLGLSNNAISDISALEDLTKLTVIQLYNNSISDISVLEDLTKLTVLGLSNNSISDISALENLTSLKDLKLAGNPISDYGPLRRLITAIEAIEDHPGLTLDITIPAVTNNAPVFTDGASTTRTVAENTAANTNIGSAIAATDADTGDTLTYTLGGTDAAAFSIVSTSGQLQTKAALDYETKISYTVTVSVSDGNSGTDSITVTINITDVDDSYLIGGRTQQVQDAIVATVPGVNSAADVTEAHLAAITVLNLRNKGITSLKFGDFDGLFALTWLQLDNNPLTSLPAGVFRGLSALTTLSLHDTYKLTNLPAGVFSGLSSLTTLELNNNKLTSLPAGVFSGLTSLESLWLSSNALTDLPKDVFKGLTSLTTLYLTHNDLTGLPAGVFSGLTSLESLWLYNNKLTSLPAGVFSGLTSLESLKLSYNRLTSLPDDIFDGLTSLTTLSLAGNAVDPFSLTVSLEKVSDGQFKAVTPTGAPFAIVLPLTVTNGSISSGATSITIPVGSVESGTLTVIRTAGTTAAVTVHIGTLPSLPSGHDGYALVRSSNLSLTVINAGVDVTNNAPIFTDGGSTTRMVAENTAANTNIGTPIAATDADTGDTLTYTLSGTDAAAFAIDSMTGQLKTKAALDYETKTAYTVTVTVSDGSLTDTINVTLNVIDVNDTRIVSGLTPVSERTPAVRDAIVAAVPSVNSAANVTQAHLATITSLNLRTKGISELKAGDFDGLSALQEIELAQNQLRTLPTEIFSGLSSLRILYLNQNQLTLLPEKLFDGVTSLEHLYLNNNQLILLPEKLFNGLVALRQINLHTNQLTSLPPKVFSGLPSLIEIFLRNNQLTDVPADVFSGLPLIHLYLDGNRLTGLPADVFSGLSSLTSLLLNNNQLSTLPTGVFRGLTASTRLWLHGNTVDPLPLIVSLEKVGANEFKAVVSAGAPFRLTLPISVANGSISNGETTVTIPQGSVESGTLSVTRTPGTTGAVTVDIGILPGLPANHQGYKPTKSANLPRTIINSPKNRVPVFTEGANTTRTVAENTATGIHIGPEVTATDADNDTLTYSLGGTDAATFAIDATTGQLKTKAALDYETKASYTVTVTGSDGSLTDTITVTINVTDINELPTTTAICKVGDVLAPGASCTYPGTDAVFSVLSDGTAQWNIPNLPTGLQWINQTSVSKSMRVSTTVNGQAYHFVAEELANNSWEIKEIGDSNNQQPKPPEQPGNTGGTPTLTVSTAVPLTEATLHEGVVTLTLSGGTYERAIFDVQKAVSVSGISGVTFDDFFDVARVSDTQATIELTFNDNMTTNGTLTISVGAGAIQDYNGTALTSQISVPAVSESVTASTAAPLTEATLDESVVTLTLNGRRFEGRNSTIRGAVSVSGISGVTVQSFDIDRQSDTEVTIELTFKGNLNADSTLTLTVGADAIAGYNGPALTAQVAVSASADTPKNTGGQNPDPPETPQQPGNQDSPQQPANTGGTPTLSVSTAAPLTEAMLHGGVITLTLSNGTFERSMFWIRNAISVSGITGVDVESFGGERISDTQATIELEYEGNMTANGTLTISLEADGIKDYEGTTLTAQIQVTASAESVTASTTAPLTEATLNGSTVTLTISGAKFARSIFDIRDAVSVSGINGVTKPWHQPKRNSDTELTVKLEFDGNMDRDGTLIFTVGADAIAGYNGPALTAQVSVSAADTPANTGGQNTDPPETPQQPGGNNTQQQPVGNTGGPPTLSVSTAAPLTEAMLHGGVITLTLSNGTFERSFFWIRNAISVSGITGVDVDFFGGKRISDTQATIELEYDGNMTANRTLTISLEADGIKDYEGATLTAQIQVTAVTESITASTAAPLTEAILDGSVVTLTLSGAKYETFIFDIRDNVTVSGIAGVTIPWHQPKRKSDTQITVELEFDGDMTTDGTLTFTVGADAIAGYNGPALTAQVAVTAERENALLANFPNPFNPDTWIPYQLEKPTDVTISIHAIDGKLVRTLNLGHQPAGIYRSRSRAAYWDGRNAFGEPVASGLYFYTLTAGDFTATRKMLIQK